uniref:Secreted protein n=1 Tax=Romanomermis culicivorax TaxID=13658 RepID=A0A915J9R9_ROMCU
NIYSSAIRLLLLIGILNKLYNSRQISRILIGFIYARITVTYCIRDYFRPILKHQRDGTNLAPPNLLCLRSVRLFRY